MKKITMKGLLFAMAMFALGQVYAQGTVDLTMYTDPNALVDTLDGLSGGEIILLQPGVTYNAGGFAFDKAVTIQSSEPSNLNRPKIYCGSNFNFGDGATVDSIIFRNLELYGEYDARYAINANVAATVGKLMFDGCYLHDLRGVLRLKDNGPGELDKYVISNSILTMIRDYGILTVDVNTWMVNHILIEGSTISKTRGFITSKNNSTSLVIDGCTLSETPAAGQRMFRWREAGQDNVTEGITISNTLWGTGWDETVGGSTGYDGFDGLGSTTWTFDNVYITSDLDIADGKDSIVGPNFVYAGLSTDLWAGLGESNFNISDAAFAGIGNAGDQRWGTASDDGGVVWNFGDAAYNALGTIVETAKVAGVTIHASADKSVTIDENGKTVGDMSFTHRLKLGGSASFEANDVPSARVVSIDLMHSATITVAAMSSSSSSDRTLNIAAGDKDNLVGEHAALGASLTMGDYTYYGAPTKLFLYSPSSGVNVYYIKITNVNNTDATLFGLSVDEGEFDQAFDPAVTSYTVSVPFGLTTVALSATLNDPNASLVGDGDIDVSSGSATATVTVTAEDGSTTTDYTVNFTVLGNSDASLSGIALSEGTLDPVFDAATFAYAVDLPEGTTSVTVTATPTDGDATVVGDGAIDVSSGSATANVVVTAADGTTELSYAVDFTVLVSVDEMEGNRMRVYPTVSTGMYQIEFADQPGRICVYDLTGKRILDRIAESNSETLFIDNEGVYLIQLSSESIQRTFKVVRLK